MYDCAHNLESNKSTKMLQLLTMISDVRCADTPNSVVRQHWLYFKTNIVVGTLLGVIGTSVCYELPIIHTIYTMALKIGQ